MDPTKGDRTTPRQSDPGVPELRGRDDLSLDRTILSRPPADAAELDPDKTIIGLPSARSPIGSPVAAAPPPDHPPEPPESVDSDLASSASMRFGIAIIKYYRVTILAVGALLIAGVWAFLTLPRTEDPEFEPSSYLMYTVYPGADAQKLEQQVAKPIEEAFLELEGIKRIESQSIGAAGVVVLIVRMEPSADLLQVQQDLENKYKEIAPDLPAGVRAPWFESYNASNIPVILLSLTGPFDLNRLADLADRVDDELSRLPGVASVELEARPERQIQVLVDNQRLSQYRIPLTNIRDILTRENAAFPGGKLDVGPRRLLIKNPNEFTSREEIENTVLGTFGGSLLRLRDVARVVDGFEDPSYLVRTDGKPALLMSVRKRAHTNTGKVAESIRSRLDDLRSELPRELEMQVISDRGVSVDNRLGNLGNNALQGAVLTMILVSLHMGIRQSLVVSISVPLSLMVCLIVMRLTGLELNQMSLFGLALALGNVVDGSCVVMENISEKLGKGMALTRAVTEGVAEVNVPVFASTLTNVASFVPLLMIGGDVGAFLKTMPWTVIITLAASYVMAVTVIPLLCYPLWKNRPPKLAPEKESRLLDFYSGLVKRALRQRTLTLVIAFGFFALSLAAIPYLGIQFFPRADVPFFLINVRLPRAASFAATDAVVRQVEAILAAEPEIRDYTANLGNGNPRVYYNVFREQLQPNYAQFLVNLKSDVKVSSEVFAQGLRQKLVGIAGAAVEPEVMEQGTTQMPAVEVRVYGEDQKILAKIAAEIRQRMEGLEGIIDLRDNLGVPTPQLRLDLDKDKAGLLGIDSYAFARTVYLAVNGEQATTLREGDEETPVVVRLDPASLTESSALNGVYLPGPERSAVPLAEVAKLETLDDFNIIFRRGGRRYVAVQCDVSGRLPSDIQGEARQLLADLELPAGYSFEIGGENEERDEAFSTLGQSLVLVLVLIYAILAIQFNSFVQPFVIVFTIPFGVVGAVLGLWLTGNPFGFMAFLGIVSLTGIVINDSILLVDYANFMQRVEGKGMYEALLLSGRRRFGPVMMTSTSTIVGLIPLGIWGGSMWSPLANALIFGDLVSTGLILLLLPVIYATLVGPKEQAREYRVLPSLWRRLFRKEQVYPY